VVEQLEVRRLPLLLFGATVAAELAAVALSWGLEPVYDTVAYAVYAVVLAGLGVLVASHQGDNPIGWLFLGAALSTAVTADLAQGWGLSAAELGWSGGPVGEVVALSSWLVSGAAIVVVFLVFPDGRMIRRSWWVLVGVLVAAVVIAVPGWAMSSDLDENFAAGVNPFAIDHALVTASRFVGTFMFLAVFAVSVVPLVLRFRGATGVQRRQLQWFGLAAVCTVLMLTPAPLLWNRTALVPPIVAVALLLIPAATCVAILRYRLFDLDVVISRTITYMALTGAIAIVYVGTVIVLGAALGTGSAWSTAGATLVAVAIVTPLRHRVQDVVDRRFSRARHDALEQIAAFVHDLHAGRAIPEDITAALRRALHTDDLVLFVCVPDCDELVDVVGGATINESQDGRRRWTLRRADRTLAMLDGPAELAERGSLIDALLEASVLPIEIASLRIGLRRQLDQVTTSRALIVNATEQERRRIERDLHDGAQQRLVSIGLSLRHAQHSLARSNGADLDPLLDDAVDQIAVVINELRELARGIRPGLLDAGLSPALCDLARRASQLQVSVDADGSRFPSEIETAAYFTACEGLTNAIKHAHATHVMLTARRGAGGLTVTVVDDGIGGAAARNGSGLTGLSTRITAHGGTLTIDSAPGHGTNLTAHFPCAS
jgi:signal transduction histidine kinase